MQRTQLDANVIVPLLTMMLEQVNDPSSRYVNLLN